MRTISTCLWPVIGTFREVQEATVGSMGWLEVEAEEDLEAVIIPGTTLPSPDTA